VSVTLAQLEQETARRVGPYSSAFTDRQVPNTANFTFATFPTLRSTIDLDSVTHLWMLRRGIDSDGNPVTLDVVDRLRLVANYDPETGQVYPDRPWGAIPVPGEVVEFHHLDPDQELRVAVLAGLRRCFLPDTIQAQPTQLFGGIDLTAQFGWLTEPWQVQRVRYGWLSPYGDAPWDTYTSAGHLILTGTHGMALPMAVWVDAWRPAWSWVNGAESTGGPVADDDTLDVDLDYAASAGHIEAWHHFPARVQAAAAGNLQATRDQAAQEFSRQANLYGPARPAEIGFGTVVRLGRGHGHASSSWVNGPW
jgi:hypothetical protein